MGWTERQAAMLKEMGLRVEVDAQAASAPAAPVVDPVAREQRALRQDLTPSASASALTSVSPASSLPSTPTTPTEAAGLAIASMDWSELRDTVAACTACKLCQGRTQTVFGVGHPQADWMVVGEAPGEQEDAQGEPFVGKSGQLLDNMLRALGISRDATGADRSRQAYIANSVKCRPPGNRNPAPDELAQCEPFLVRQIALLQPKIILAMGKFAVQSLLRSAEPIGKLRGRVHHYQGVPLIVTYHPAYLLRNLDEKARAWDDLCLAAETVERAERADEPADTQATD